MEYGSYYNGRRIRGCGAYCGGGAYFGVTAQGCGAYWEAVLIWGPAFIGGNTVGGPYVLALGNVSDHGSDRALVLIGICLIL